MKKLFATILAFLLFLAQVPVIAEPSAINCKVAEINTYGHAVLDITDEDFYKAGFALGDIVTVTAGSYTGDMPCFNGYYVDREATLVYINPFVGRLRGEKRRFEGRGFRQFPARCGGQAVSLRFTC